MEKNTFIDKLIGKTSDIPSQADVIELKQLSLDDMHRRSRKLLSVIGHSCGCNYERGDWSVQQDSTLIRLPQGARAMIYHASGAMRLDTGMAPMERLFAKMEEKTGLTKLVERTARTLNIQQWVAETEQLKFERLWQIKAAAADKSGKMLEPVLCRAIGAYRHYVNELPVLGAASVAVKVAAEGQLDSLSVLARQTSGRTLDRIKTISAEQALEKVYQQLGRLMGKGKIPLAEIAHPQSIQFGYLSLSKRKSQRLLEPAYMVMVSIEGQQEAQGYMFAIPGSDSPYMPLARVGAEPVTLSMSRYVRQGNVEEREQMAAC